MMHPDTELRFINEAIGYGVFASRDIPAGTITWAQDHLDQEFTPARVRTLGHNYAEILDKYCFRNQRGNWILCWDHARFVNHSFNSNCLTTAYNFEVAIRDIAAGEELTDDYGYLNVSRPFRPHDEGVRRKIVYPDDLLRFHPVWDRKLLAVWDRIPQREQALLPYIEERHWKSVVRIARGQKQMPSILECYAGPRPEPQPTTLAPSSPSRATRSARPAGRSARAATSAPVKTRQPVRAKSDSAAS